MPNIDHPTATARRLARLKTHARRQDVLVRKARGGLHANNHGELMLVDLYRNAVIAGPNFDLTLTEAEEIVHGWSQA